MVSSQIKVKHRENFPPSAHECENSLVDLEGQTFKSRNNKKNKFLVEGDYNFLCSVSIRLEFQHI